jgi:hypothetical protein
VTVLAIIPTLAGGATDAEHIQECYSGVNSLYGCLFIYEVTEFI